MNKEGKITISVNEEDVQNIINAYEKDIEYINQLEKENEQLKDNWNKLKEYIVKEYYMYLPLEASTRSITILIDKMQEIEGSDSNE